MPYMTVDKEATYTGKTMLNSAADKEATYTAGDALYDIRWEGDALYGRQGSQFHWEGDA